jgi:hypothetical protein
MNGNALTVTSASLGAHCAGSLHGTDWYCRLGYKRSSSHEDPLFGILTSVVYTLITQQAKGNEREHNKESD